MNGLEMHITRVRIARKEHQCAYKNHLILPGERYIDETIPPWAMFSDDVDDEGRAIYSRHNEWWNVRYHAECRTEYENGYY